VNKADPSSKGQLSLVTTYLYVYVWFYNNTSTKPSKTAMLL